MEEESKEYRWETGYEKTWEAITEDDEGLLETSVQELIQKARRKRMLEKTSKTGRLGMMRHVFIVLDMSQCMTMQDLKPTRIRCVVKILENFIEEFFYLNPISQIGIIVSKNKRAENFSDLAGNPRKHIVRLKQLGQEEACIGEPSLQNSLEVAMQALKHMPAHASRELVVIMGSLTTCDPGDIEKSIQRCKELNIRCSVISLAAEVRIYRELTRVTEGEFAVILDDLHLRDLLSAHLEPPESTEATESSLIKMGFPSHSGLSAQSGSSSGLGMCLCHLMSSTLGDSGAPAAKLSSTGFLCPQCNAKYCELPVECKTCGLTLVSAPHLARSYHHLFPLPAFKEIPSEDARSGFCFACTLPLVKDPTTKSSANNSTEKSASNSGNTAECPSCKKSFCFECDIFIHETLHTCPGCASKHSFAQANGVKKS